MFRGVKVFRTTFTARLCFLLPLANGLPLRLIGPLSVHPGRVELRVSEQLGDLVLSMSPRC